MNTASTRRASFALALLVTALLAACGGGASSGSGGYPPPGGGGGGGGGYGGGGGGEYIATALVTDTATSAAHQDPLLVNAWGLAFNPSGYAWVANEDTSTSTLYDGNGTPQSLVVQIPHGAVGTGNPSGIVFNGTTDFSISVNGVTGTAPFVFATLEGQIASWSPSVDMTHAFTLVDNGTAGAGYTGLAMGVAATGNLLYAADFPLANVDVFDATYAATTTPGGFIDPTLPAGYAPFGIQQAGGRVYVAYALQDSTGQAEVHGAGLGQVDVFDTQGTLLSRLVPAGGVLNAPWGMAIAPSTFGHFAGMLLVGNFGDGRINAFDPTTGAFQGALSNNDGTPIVIDGLWGLAFGNGLFSQPTSTLFYTAGPGGEAHGLYGRIDLN